MFNLNGIKIRNEKRRKNWTVNVFFFIWESRQRWIEDKKNILIKKIIQMLKQFEKGKTNRTTYGWQWDWNEVEKSGEIKTHTPNLIDGV